jgi:hypothetical protein
LLEPYANSGETPYPSNRLTEPAALEIVAHTGFFALPRSSYVALNRRCGPRTLTSKAAVMSDSATFSTRADLGAIAALAMTRSMWDKPPAASWAAWMAVVAEVGDVLSMLTRTRRVFEPVGRDFRFSY